MLGPRSRYAATDEKSWKKKRRRREMRNPRNTFMEATSSERDELSNRIKLRKREREMLEKNY